MTRPKLRGRAGKLILKGLSQEVSRVAVSADGTRIAAVDWSGMLAVWAPWEPTARHTVSAHDDRAQGVCFLQDDRWIATSGFDRRVRVWDAATLTLLQEYTHPPQGRLTVRAWGLEASPNGRWLSAHIQSGKERVYRVWPVVDGQVLLHAHRDLPGPARFSTHPDAVVCMVKQDDCWLLQIRTLDTDTLLGSVELGRSAVRPSFATTTDGATAAVTEYVPDDDSQRIALVDLHEQVVNHRFSVSGGGSWGFSPDGRLLASASGRWPQVWDTWTGQALMDPAWCHRRTVSHTTFTPDGTTLVSCGWDRTVRLWDLTANLASLPDQPPSWAALPARMRSEPTEAPPPAYGVPEALGPDALFDRGEYAAALAGYQTTPVVLDGVEPDWNRCFGLLDQSLCHHALGDERAAHGAWSEAGQAVRAHCNYLTRYARSLLEASRLDKAHRVARAAFARDGFGPDYGQTAHTWLCILEARGEESLLPQLVCHWLEDPSSAAPLFERHQAAIRAFLDRRPRPDEHVAMQTFFRRNRTDGPRFSRLAGALLSRDAERWTPEVLLAARRWPLDATANPGFAAVTDPEAALSLVAERVRRWLDRELAHRGDPRLVPQVHDFLCSGVKPSNFLGKLRKQSPNRPKPSGFYSVFGTGLGDLPASLAMRMEFLALSLDGQSALADWTRQTTTVHLGGAEPRTSRARSGPPLRQVVEAVCERQPDGYVLLAHLLGRADHALAREAFVHLLRTNPERALAGVLESGAAAQVALLPVVAATEQALGTELALQLAGTGARTVRAQLVKVLSADRGAEQQLRVLARAGRKKAARELACEVLHVWGEGP